LHIVIVPGARAARNAGCEHVGGPRRRQRGRRRVTGIGSLVSDPGHAEYATIELGGCSRPLMDLLYGSNDDELVAP
jgi:hypothetical protein